MTGSQHEPVRQSELSAHAGSVAGPEQASAGCASPTGEESQADAPPQAVGDSAGCAAPIPADASESRVTPPQTMRELERALRGLGLTRLQATHVARKGFSGMTASAVPEPEPDDDIDLLRRALQRRNIESKP